MRLRPAVVLTLALASVSPAVAAVSRVGSEFQVTTYTTSDQESPAVAMSPTGEFVVVWTSLSQDGSSYGIFGQRFDSSGMPAGTEFQVNTYTSSHQTRPSIAVDGSGGFVVVWDSYFQDGDRGGIFGQRLDSAAQRVGQEFRVNTYTPSYQYEPTVAAGASGEFVVAWIGSGLYQYGHLRDIFARRFDSSGMPSGGDFRVNTYTGGLQLSPAVAMDDSGAFVVAWESHDAYGSYDGIFAPRFDSDGMPSGDEFQVNTYTTGYQFNPAIASHPGGDFMVVWRGPKAGKLEISGQRYSSGGLPMGGEFRVASSVPENQDYPTIAGEATGGFVVAWGESLSDGSGDGIVGRRIGSGG